MLLIVTTLASIHVLHTLDASCSSVSLCSHGTSTVDFVVQDLAVSCVVTGILDGARVFAVSVDASLFRRTLSVVGAVHGRAQDVGVAIQSGGTRASGLVTGTSTQSVGSTRLVIGSADRSAFIEATRVVVGAVGIHETLHSLAVEFRISVIARLRKNKKYKYT